MARRNYRKSSKKIQPSVLKMNFAFSTVKAQKKFDYIDLSQCASILNRRFYRQGLNWAVAGFKVLAPQGLEASSGVVSIHKLPNTWVLSNSWEKGFRAWQRMNNEALKEAPSVKPKFLDFKIYANADHHSSGFANNLLPISAATSTAGVQTATAGEWASSKITHPVATGATEGTVIEEEIIAVGQSYPGASPATTLNAVSLIEGYAASRGLPNISDPNTPDDARDTQNATPENWLSAMFNEGTQQDFEVLGEMITENTIAPYPFENDGVNTDTMYPGGANQLNSLEIHDQQFITGTTVGGTTRFTGGNFPCGLIEIGTSDFSDIANLFLEVTLVPGDHRGYLAESMTDM